MIELPMMAGVAGAIEGEVLARSTEATGATEPSGEVMAFSFGDPQPVLDRREFLQSIHCWHNGRWFEPPVSMDGLVRAFDVAPHHASCIRLKRNLLSKYFVPSRWLDRPTFDRFALDYLVTGNGYLEQRDNLAKRPMKMEHSLARYTRRGVEEGRYYFVPGWKQEHEFLAGKVFQLMEAHPSQEIYGLPEYLSSLQSALLNENATLFRRKYYLNGSHAGFIFYAAGAGISNVDADKIRGALRESKGPGNFRNLFLHAPNGRKDDVQIISIGEATAKDEFLNIKNTTRDDMLAAHRVPPQLLGVVPTNSGGFGDVAKASEVFFQLEIEPLQMRFLELNDWLGVEAVAFREFVPSSAAAA